MKSYKVGVKTYGEPDWVYNQLRFATFEEAKAWGDDLFARWTLAEKTEVHESDDPVNYAYVDGVLKPAA